MIHWELKTNDVVQRRRRAPSRPLLLNRQGRKKTCVLERSPENAFEQLGRHSMGAPRLAGKECDGYSRSLPGFPSSPSLLLFCFLRQGLYVAQDSLKLAIFLLQLHPTPKLLGLQVCHSPHPQQDVLLIISISLKTKEQVYQLTVKVGEAWKVCDEKT
jgi:hypothetical protein